MKKKHLHFECCLHYRVCVYMMVLHKITYGVFKSCQKHCIYELNTHEHHDKVVIMSGKPGGNYQI